MENYNNEKLLEVTKHIIQWYVKDMRTYKDDKGNQNFMEAPRYVHIKGSNYVVKLGDEAVILENSKIKERKLLLEFSEYLLHLYNNDLSLYLSKEDIEKYLFDRESNTINSLMLDIFNRLEVDMTGVSFDGIYLNHERFQGVKNVVINLDTIIDKDLRNCHFKNVKFTGSFDNCKLYFTHFDKCNSESKIDLQKVSGKNITGTKFGDMKVFGSTDGIDIGYADFSEVQGDVYINPQKLPNKHLYSVSFNNCFIVGDDGSLNPSFEGCRIESTSFAGARNKATINLNELGIDDKFHPRRKLYNVDLTGVILTGNIYLGGKQNVKSCNIVSCSYLDYNGKTYGNIDLDDPESYGMCPDIKVNVYKKSAISSLKENDIQDISQNEELPVLDDQNNAENISRKRKRPLSIFSRKGRK